MYAMSACASHVFIALTLDLGNYSLLRLHCELSFQLIMLCYEFCYRYAVHFGFKIN